MKITDVKTYLVKGYHDRLRWVLVHVETDEGLVGLGDATNWPHGEIIVQAIQCLKEHVVGESPFDIERIWRKMYGALIPLGYGGVQVSALCGIESACWDIVGQAAGLPIYNLLGGKVHDRLRLFAICGDRTKGTGKTEFERRIDAAQWAVDQGYTCIKYSPKGRALTWKYIEEAGRLGLELREVMGPELDISVDLGNVTDVDTAIRFAESVGRCDPIYMELHAPENIDALVKINRAVRAPLCIGEHQWARFGFREALERHAVEVINPDVVRTGGIAEARNWQHLTRDHILQIVEGGERRRFEVIDNKIRALVRASSNPSHLEQLLHVMQQTAAERKTAVGPIFHDLAERFKKRGIVVILSDLFDDVDAMMAGLKHFRHRRHEVILFHVLDPAEIEFPFRRTTLFRGLEELPHVLVEPRALRKAYLRQFEGYLRRLKTGCRMHQIDYVLMRTDQPLDVALSSYLASRMTRVNT